MFDQFLQVAIGVLAAVHYTVVSTLLPAIHGSFFSQVLKNAVPPITLVVGYGLTRVLPPVTSVIPLVMLTPVHMAAFPLADLILLSVSVSITATRHRHALLLVTAGFAATLCIPPLRLRILRTPFPVAALLVATIASALSLRSLSLRSTMTRMTTLRKHKTKRSRTGRHSSGLPTTTTATARTYPIIGVMTFVVTLMGVMVTAPMLASGLRAVRPRQLPTGYRILAQRRGVTGLVSVVEKLNSHRMLTADLSVLGGFYIKQGYAPDSIFSQFHVHEAVRLSYRSDRGIEPHNDAISTENTTRNGDSSAAAGGRNGRTLCIGVGVGVVARSLRAHGCKVDAVELDAAVASFARDWFSLKVPVIVQDARRFLDNAAGASYDFVVHDAFSGGGIDPSLVTRAELARLRRVLKADGVLAINVVSSTRGTTAAVARVIGNRLHEVFGHVRLFSEGGRGRIDNIVLFASQTGSAIRFRKPVQRDFLGSDMRQAALVAFERFEVKIDGLPKGWSVPKLFAHAVEQVELIVGMCVVGAVHAHVMGEVHPPDLWSALLAVEGSR